MFKGVVKICLIQSLAVKNICKTTGS